MLLYVDPGLRSCGAALFRAGVLTAAALPQGSRDTDQRRVEQRAETWIDMAMAVRRWAEGEALKTGETVEELSIELPQIYQAGHQSANKRGADPNDLIQLAATVGGVCLTFVTIPQRVLLPAEWKRQIPKAIMHARALARLSPEEQARIPKLVKSKLHNVLDAVTMGLVAAGRLRV